MSCTILQNVLSNEVAALAVKLTMLERKASKARDLWLQAKGSEQLEEKETYDGLLKEVGELRWEIRMTILRQETEIKLSLR